MDLKEISAKKINKILQYRERIGSNVDPVCIQAAITDFCFNKCLNCDHHLRINKKIISGDDWINFLKKHPKIESIAYLGGDLMTHPDINQIMRYHFENDVSFGMVIAGFIPSTVSLMLLSWAKWVRVSLDTINPIVYKKARGGVAVESVLNCIDRMRFKGIKIELCVTVSRHNINNLEDVFEYAISKKIGLEIHPMFGQNLPEKATKIIDRYAPIFKENNIDFSFFCYANFKFKKCVAPYYQIYIDTDGDIYPCCASSGDLHTNKNKLNMGNIDNWDGFLKNRANHKMIYKACKTCCDNTTRINYIIEQFPKQNNFF